MERSIDDLGTGTTFKAISGQTLRQLEAPIADLEYQEHAIAEIEKQFSRLDEAVANLKRVKANLKRHKAAVLHAAVKARLGADRAASDEDLPTGWRWSSVGELATVGTGATPARSNQAFYRGRTIPWVTSSAVNEPFVQAAEQFVTDEALRQTNLSLYPPGTLLVAMYGEGKTRGKCSELCIAATTNQALAALQVDPAARPWLKLFLEHNYDNTRRIASGGGQPNLNLGLIRAIRLPLPPAEEQHRIVAEVDRRLSIVRAVEAEVDVNLKRAQGLRQAVLQHAFTGGCP
jgi:type I restriction enzyme S subunit